jgi:16S rRNA G1207 methylase RsmC
MSSLSDKADQVLLKIPKSLGLFELFLSHIAQNSNPSVEVTCAFMTRHFNASLVALAAQFFEKVEQSKAFKKSRLLKLSGLKKQNEVGLIKSIDYKGKEYKQYLGVFSANHIDYATQFFLDNIDLSSGPEIIMDLASGNGVMANEISQRVAVTEMHLMDDFLLAVESGKLNVTQENVHHHYASDLEGFESEKFDLIVSNPPFHFEHDINIQIPIALLRSSHRCLKHGGNLQIVSNKHLNYPVHLKSLFSSISVIAENDKFRVYQCTK